MANWYKHQQLKLQIQNLLANHNSMQLTINSPILPIVNHIWLHINLQTWTSICKDLHPPWLLIDHITKLIIEDKLPCKDSIWRIQMHNMESPHIRHNGFQHLLFTPKTHFEFLHSHPSKCMVNGSPHPLKAKYHFGFVLM